MSIHIEDLTVRFKNSVTAIDHADLDIPNGIFTMLGTFYTGYKGSKEGHKYFAASSLLCMIMAIYTGHKMISGKSRKKKEVSVESVED